MTHAGKIYMAAAVLLLLSGRSVSAPAGDSVADLDTGHAYTVPELVEMTDSASNVIVDPEGRMMPFVDKLARIRQGSNETVSIVHIGDSHVQAGFFTDVLRECFQRDFGCSGRGLVVPLRLMGTNEPAGYSIKSSNRWAGATCIRAKEGDECVGVAGMGIASQDSRVEFEIAANAPFNTVRAFHHPQAPLLREPDELSLGTSCPQEDGESHTVICLSDTVRSVKLAATAQEGYNHQTYYGFSLETGEPGVLYHSAGINGAAFAHYNNNPCIPAFQRALVPDLVIVSLGTNDSFGNNYREEDVAKAIGRFIEMYVGYFPDVPLLFTTPMESCRRSGRRGYAVNDNVARTAAVIKDVAAERGLPYWDLYGAAGGTGANKRWLDRKLMNGDRIHLTREGYAFQGEMLYDALSRYYNEAVKI